MDLQNRENFLDKLAGGQWADLDQNVPEPMPVLENNHAILAALCAQPPLPRIYRFC